MQKEITKDILHNIPVQYMTMRAAQQTAHCHENVKTLIMPTSTFRRQRLKKTVECCEGVSKGTEYIPGKQKAL